MTTDEFSKWLDDIENYFDGHDGKQYIPTAIAGKDCTIVNWIGVLTDVARDCTDDDLRQHIRAAIMQTVGIIKYYNAEPLRSNVHKMYLYFRYETDKGIEMQKQSISTWCIMPCIYKICTCNWQACIASVALETASFVLDRLLKLSYSYNYKHGN